MADKVRSIGVLKRGADFTLPGETTHVVADFSQALEPSPPTAYQVKRAEFDELLLRHAEQAGVMVHERTKATAVQFDGDNAATVESRNDKGETQTWQTRFLVDASGRDTFLGNRLNLKMKNPDHENAAIFAHFDNVLRRDGEEAGNISMYFFDYGWYWFIPLRDGRMSIGAVCRPTYLKSRTAGRSSSSCSIRWRGARNSLSASARPRLPPRSGPRAISPMHRSGCATRTTC